MWRRRRWRTIAGYMERARWHGGGTAADDGDDDPATPHAANAVRSRPGPAAGRIGGLEIRHAGAGARIAVHADHLRSRSGYHTRHFSLWEADGVRFRPRQGPQPGTLCAT